ncbi:EAL domain-containing protein [Shewanella sp. SR44-3]|uniref:EAL domain-containing protein n=1 Tax=unclassified Shewanella TaxID=196818 RepID=UPI0015FCC226|nr:EAL domain-containing protein [Shewanella sp. SR44-3]MBB1270859.1 EAL domain-containing protein [Shewanella sp. SR44-3]
MDINHLSLSCEYQPLIDPQSLAVWGYEALSRFKDSKLQPIPPNLVFERLHDSPELFAQVEYLAKSFQLAHAPSGRLFINIDPHGMQGHWIEPMLALLAPRPDLTVELIENTCMNEAQMAIDLIHMLKLRQISCALDDIGAPGTMLCFELMTKMNYLKFDRHWLTKLDDSDNYALLSSLIDYGKRTGKLCILEGIETQQQLLWAQKLKVDLVQGFLFKPQFINPQQAVSCHKALALAPECLIGSSN